MFYYEKIKRDFFLLCLIHLYLEDISKRKKKEKKNFKPCGNRREAYKKKEEKKKNILYTVQYSFICIYEYSYQNIYIWELCYTLYCILYIPFIVYKYIYSLKLILNDNFLLKNNKIWLKETDF